MKVIEIVWLDAHCSTDDTSIKKAKLQQPVKTVTVGFLVAENTHGLVLATDRYTDDKESVKMTNFVPWGMIEEYWEYAEVDQ